jgi:alkylated DNA repair dioxygenase AlkB
MPGEPATLFGLDLPAGFSHRDDFITIVEERQLIEAIREIKFDAFEMRGVVARRRVAFFGHTYDTSREAQGRIPDFLSSVRSRLADWAGLEPSAFAMALINEYPPGAPIGWHRDAPQYGIIAGVSLLSSCRMKLRPYVSPDDTRTAGRPVRKATHEITLWPRSAYLIQGLARSGFEHSIPPVESLRYSITLRTMRVQSGDSVSHGAPR